MEKWIRIIAMVLAIIATIVLHLIPGGNNLVEWVSLIASFVLAVWNAWKNNDFTFAAKVGTKVMNAIKDGKITVDEIEALLDTKDE